MEESKKLSALPIAGAFIGTVVGAGFATGQEVFQFFTVFGRFSVLGIMLAAFLFCYFGLLIMIFSRRLKAVSHLDLVRYTSGNKIGILLDWFITLSFLGVLVVMAAGAGAVAEEQLGFSSLAGSLLIMILTFGTVLSGLNNVIKTIGLIVPFLLVTVLAVALISIISNPISPEKLSHLHSVPPAAAANWASSSILYVSYNLLLAVAILAPLGTAAKNRDSLLKGAFLGGLGLGAGLLAINFALLSGLPQILAYEVPMVYLASSFHPLLALAYGIILLLEIFSTTVSVLFGFVSRMALNSRQKFFWAGFASLSSILASQLGFSRIVATVYPLMGYFGIIFLVIVLRKHLDGNIRSFLRKIRK